MRFVHFASLLGLACGSGCVLVVDFDDYKLAAGGTAGEGGGPSNGGAPAGGGGAGAAGGPDGGGGADPCVGVDFETDNEHCGGCEHSCDGTACVGGLCEPSFVDLSANGGDPGEPRTMIAAGSVVYVSVDVDPSVGHMIHLVRVDADALTQTAESIRVVTALPFGMSVLDDAVLMTGQYMGLTACDLALGSCATQGSSILNGMAPAGPGQVLLLDYSTTSLQAYDGERFSEQWDTGKLYGNSIATNSHRAAMSFCQPNDCTGDGAICTVLLEELPVGGTPPDCPVEGASGNIQLAGPVALHEDDTIYFIHDDSLGRVRSGQVSSLFSDAVNVVVDERFLYVLRDGNLAFCANAGECRSPVAFPDVPADTSYGLTQNERYVFFGAGTRLYRVRKPAPEWEANAG